MSAEQSFADAAALRGLKVLRAGWPDFAVMTPRGTALAFVEIKDGRDDLRPGQIAMHEVLRTAGIVVQVLRPQQFEAFLYELTLPPKARKPLGTRARPYRPIYPAPTFEELADAVQRLEGTL